MVGLGRLEDQESTDSARGGCGRAWWLPNTNVIRVKIRLRIMRVTGVDSARRSKVKTEPKQPTDDGDGGAGDE